MAVIGEAEELALRAIERGDAGVDDVRPWRRDASGRAQQVLQSAPDLRRLAGNLSSAGRLDEAEMVARFLAANYGEDFLSLETAGDVSRQLDDPGGALRRYQRAVLLEGQPRVARLGIARVLAKMGDAGEELGLSRPALDFYYRSATLLTAQLSDRVDDPWEWYEPWRGPAPIDLLSELRKRAERLEAQLRHLSPAVMAALPAPSADTAPLDPTRHHVRGTALRD